MASPGERVVVEGIESTFQLRRAGWVAMSMVIILLMAMAAGIVSLAIHNFTPPPQPLAPTTVYASGQLDKTVPILASPSADAKHVADAPAGTPVDMVCYADVAFDPNSTDYRTVRWFYLAVNMGATQPRIYGWAESRLVANQRHADSCGPIGRPPGA